MPDDVAPLVTVLIPARNEERELGGALKAVAAQDYPHDRIEVIVVDGGSSDRTSEVARSELAKHSFAATQVLVNEEPTTPSNLNLGLAHAQGEYLCRIDARSIVPPDYVRRCVETLATRSQVAVVGGAQVAVPRTETAIQSGIARALNNRLVMGLSRYRRGASSGPTDTVFLGAFRVSDMRAIGGWDETYATNQDYELNRRLAGLGLVWFEESLRVQYLPRESLRALFAQYHRFGRWKVEYWRRSGDPPRPRQLVLVLGPVLIATTCILAWRRWPRGRPMLAAAGAVAFLAIDETGSSDRAASCAMRLASLAASAAVAGGWLSGIGIGLLRMSHSESPRS